jgi:hypothetical protein
VPKNRRVVATLQIDRHGAFADDELGAAAADVDHQATAALRRQALGDAEVDESRLLAAGDHFDAMTERGLTGYQERLRVAQLAHGIGGDRANPVGGDVAQSLAHALQAFQRTPERFLGKFAALGQARGGAHRLAQTVDHAQLSKRVTGHDHVEAVRAEIHRGQQLVLGEARGVGLEQGLGHARILQWQSRASRNCWAECGISSPSGASRS